MNINAVIFEANPAVYKFRGEFFHRASDYFIYILLSKNIVAVIRAKAHKDEHHLDILLYTRQFGCESARFGHIFFLKSQAHRRYRRFYLVRPDGVVIDGVAYAAVRLRRYLRYFFLEHGYQLLIVGINYPLRLGQSRYKFGVPAVQLFKKLVAAIRFCNIIGGEHRAEKQAQGARIHHGAHGQTVEPKRNREYAGEKQKHQKPLPPLLEITLKKAHNPSEIKLLYTLRRTLWR